MLKEIIISSGIGMHPHSNDPITRDTLRMLIIERPYMFDGSMFFLAGNYGYVSYTKQKSYSHNPWDFFYILFSKAIHISFI
jgi:hypothetical protein